MITESSIAIVVTIVVAHFVGDFWAQSDKMALNKSKSNKWLLAHVAVDTAFIAALTLPMVVLYQRSVFTWVAWVLLNGAVHFVIDYFTSRRTTLLWFLDIQPAYAALIDIPIASASVNKIFLTGGSQMKRLTDYLNREAVIVTDKGTRHAFFVTIGFDQMLHYLTLFLTAYWLL